VTYLLRLAGAFISCGANRTTTLYDDIITPVPAEPEDTDAYRARAIALGYGSDTAAMSRDHELGHHLLAHWLGLPHSPTLYAVAGGNLDHPLWRLEEGAVLALQAFAMAQGLRLEDVARRIG
jgi:hypothetical protein